MTDPFTSRKIHFLGELEGPPVQELKQQLAPVIGHDDGANAADHGNNCTGSPNCSLTTSAINCSRLLPSAGRANSDCLASQSSLKLLARADTQI